MIMLNFLLKALLLTAKDAINEIKNDTTMKALWKAYQNKFSYAQNITWEEAIASTLTILKNVIYNIPE